MISQFLVIAYGMESRHMVWPGQKYTVYEGNIRNVIAAARRSNDWIPFAVRVWRRSGPTFAFKYNRNEFTKRSDEYIYKHVQFILENFA